MGTITIREEQRVRKNFLLLAFVSGVLFLIGNNVLADETIIIDLPPVEITCSQSSGYMAQCWIACPATFPNTGENCVWTGSIYHFCFF